MDSNVLLTIVISLISSGVVGTILTTAINAISRNNPLKVAVRLLLQAELTSLCKRALEDEDGKIPYNDLKLILHMYESYKSLNGNGDMEQLMERVKKLDIYID